MKIKARIPADNGKTIRCCSGPGGTFVVAATACEDCDCDATVVVQGETDSFGWEPVFLCEECLAKTEAAVGEHEAAVDVEDREGFFWICECTNYDGHGNWYKTFTSYRQAVQYLRRIEDLAAPWSGLYPNEGIRECKSIEDFQAVKRRIEKIRKQEMEEEYR